METRVIGKNKQQTSLFGVGCMRFPTQAGPDGKSVVDECEAIRMIRYAIDNGVTYFDTGYHYHGGQSEVILGKALADGYRERALVATKMPLWDVNTAADFTRIFEEQRQRLQTDCFDFYLLHALNDNLWQKALKLGVLDFLDGLRQTGKIRQVGFSFHDELPVFKKIIDSYDWDMCQIQLNILDVDYQAGLAGLEYAAARDIDVVIMEPLRGGALAHKIPSDIAAVWKGASIQRSPVEWAFRWLYNFSQVKVILSGVSDMAQLKDNIRIFSEAGAGSMTGAEQDLVSQVQKLYQQKIKVGCTACNYCMPCPFDVDIPGVFGIYNGAYLFDDLAGSRSSYSRLKENGHAADLCTACGQCESVCPQNIQIIAMLAQAHQVLFS